MLADAIVEATETGSTLRANRLRIIETLLESNTQLIANKGALGDPWKQPIICGAGPDMGAQEACP